MTPLQAYDLDRLNQSMQLVGVDEAGRGCLAGPVVAGACVLSAELFESESALELSSRINDSKQLSAEGREEQFAILEQLRIEGLIDFAVAEGSVEEIAAHNILGATRLAMQRAVEEVAARQEVWSLPSVYDDPLFEVGTAGLIRPQQLEELRTPEGRHPCQVTVIVDGRPLKPFPYAHEGVVKGDGKSLCIAMASIAAKVTRDRTMAALDKQFPEYGFAKHKGYGTAAHRSALKAHGASSIHRELFLRKVL